MTQDRAKKEGPVFHSDFTRNVIKKQKITGTSFGGILSRLNKLAAEAQQMSAAMGAESEVKQGKSKVKSAKVAPDLPTNITLDAESAQSLITPLAAYRENLDTKRLASRKPDAKLKNKLKVLDELMALIESLNFQKFVNKWHQEKHTLQENRGFSANSKKGVWLIKNVDGLIVNIMQQHAKPVKQARQQPSPPDDKAESVAALETTLEELVKSPVYIQAELDVKAGKAKTTAKKPVDPEFANKLAELEFALDSTVTEFPELFNKGSQFAKVPEVVKKELTKLDASKPKGQDKFLAQAIVKLELYHKHLQKNNLKASDTILKEKLHAVEILIKNARTNDVAAFIKEWPLASQTIQKHRPKSFGGVEFKFTSVLPYEGKTLVAELNKLIPKIPNPKKS